MIIDGVKKRMEDEPLKVNYVYFIDDRTRRAYFFDEDFRLNKIPGMTAIYLTCEGKLDGLCRERYSNNIYIWHPSIELDEIEQAALKASVGKSENGRGCSFNYIKEKIRHGRRTGSVKIPHRQLHAEWHPKKKGDPTYGEFDLDRFISKVEIPIMERYVENRDRNTFDFIRLRMYTITNEENPLDIIKDNKNDILNMAVKRIEEAKRFKRFGIPTNFLKLDRFTYSYGQNMIELIFILKPIGGGLVELSPES